MATLGQRLKELRRERNLTQEEFGKTLNVVKSTISLYENNKISPDDELKKSMAKYFGVTLDYLMGVSNIRNPYKDNVVDTKEEIDEEENSLGEDDVIAAHSDKKTVKLTKEDLLEIEDFLNKRRNKKK